MITLVEGVVWLFITTYHESRDQSIRGMADVVHVILNRVERRQKSVKQIVLASKQFSCFNNGTEQPISETAGMIKTAIAIAQVAMERMEGKFTSADHYHRFDVNPYWDDDMIYLGQVGAHQFFDSGRRRN